MASTKIQINFTDLPCNIKRAIYKINRDHGREEAVRNKRKYSAFVADLKQQFSDDEVCESGLFHWHRLEMLNWCIKQLERKLDLKRWESV